MVAATIIVMHSIANNCGDNMPGVELHPVHFSIRAMLAKGTKFKPRAMSSVRMARDDYEAMQRVAMEIFADCTNVGVPFQEAIAAVYLSGLQNGSELRKEIKCTSRPTNT